MRYAVTGATGCLGLNLTRRLIRDGHEVIALGRNKKLGALLTEMGAEFIAVDLCNGTALKNHLKHADVIFHTAALSSPWGKYSDFYKANVLGTQHVINATPEGVRLIHVSTPSIYFNYTEQHNISENIPLEHKPANHYVKTKLLAEHLVDDAYKKNNLQVITLRPRAIFGPFDRAILPRLLRAEKKGILPIIGQGNNLIDITCVDNVVESLVLAATADSVFCGNKYNITNDEPKTLISILELLFLALNKPLQLKRVPYSFAKKIAFCMELIHRTNLLGEPRLTRYTSAVLALGQTLNIQAAKRDLRYRPLVSIEDGIQQFAHWYTNDTSSIY